MIYWFKRKRKQIARVISFLPIIWKGHDWDYQYSIELFQHQLKRTAKEIRVNGVNVDREQIASRIETAVELLDKVYNETYAYEWVKLAETKYGPSQYCLDTFTERYERDYTADERLLIEEDVYALRHESQAKHQKATRLVWKYIEHNITRWWD